MGPWTGKNSAFPRCITRYELTARKVLSMINFLMPDLIFILELQEEFDDEMIPTLDMNMGLLPAQKVDVRFIQYK